MKNVKTIDKIPNNTTLLEVYKEENILGKDKYVVQNSEVVIEENLKKDETINIL